MSDLHISKLSLDTNSASGFRVEEIPLDKFYLDPKDARITQLESENAQLRTERDGARAAMAKEAADKFEAYAFEASDRGDIDGELMARDCRKAILALAETPKGFVCVKVDDLKAIRTETALGNTKEALNQLNSMMEKTSP